MMMMTGPIGGVGMVTRRITVVEMNQEGLGLGYETRTLPKIKSQRRKKPAKSNLQTWNMMGADTETIEGKVWLFSTEKGVWKTPTFAHLMQVLYNDVHTKKWRNGKGQRGRKCFEYFFWNLKFDAQAILRTLAEEVILDLVTSREYEGEISSNKVLINVDTADYLPIVNGRMVELSYLEGKSLTITPKNFYRGSFKLGPCKWWDISQFYNKMRLNNAAKKYLNKNKLEECFDGTILDASRFDEPDYRDYYAEDIDKYAIIDAQLAGELARLKRNHFVSSGVRFIQPYSLANVAQRACLDTCKIPTINSYTKSEKGLSIMKQALSAYQGGWFETIGSGYHPDVTGVDLASAYPYVMYHLPDIDEDETAWIQGDDKEHFTEWLGVRKPYTIGFAECMFLFDSGKWNPLAKMSSTGTIVTPRLVRGWFTADEIQEALKWPHSQFEVGRWFYQLDTETRPFRPFIEKFYEMKNNSEKGTVEYMVSKTCLNSLYGKTIQAVNNKAGKLWNPFYAATITGATRARLAELIRVNNFDALSVATDGVLFPTDKLTTIPLRPLPAPYNLGEWELEERGELVMLMSGVYSIKTSDFTKTTFRGSASLFMRNYNEGGLFTFCEENENDFTKSTTIRRPYSAGEARVRRNMSLMNVFEEFSYTIRPAGDSTKRLWGRQKPRTFGDLLTRWWPSFPHEQLI